MSRLVLLIVFLTLTLSNIFAYNPPSGGNLSDVLSHPDSYGNSKSVTSNGSPSDYIFNPAANANLLKLMLGFSYSSITDFDKKIGHAASVDLFIPQSYGAWSAGLSFLSLPGIMDNVPLGSFMDLRLAFSMPIINDLFIGLGLTGRVGLINDQGYGISANVGVSQFKEELGFLKDFSWAVVVSGLGKSYLSSKKVEGIFGGDSDSWESPFTLSASIKAKLLKMKEFSIALGIDLSTPTFQDFGFGANLGFAIFDTITINASWFRYLKELLNGPSCPYYKRSYLPSFSILASIPLPNSTSKSYSGVEKISPYVGFAPLYGEVYALGAGTNITFGALVNKNPPLVNGVVATTQLVTSEVTAAIRLDPKSFSPDKDGVNDKMNIGISVKSKLPIESWKLEIFEKSVDNESGKNNASSERVFKTWTGVGTPPVKIIWDGLSDYSELVESSTNYPYKFSVLDTQKKAASLSGVIPVDLLVFKDGNKLRLKVSSIVFSPDGYDFAGLSPEVLEYNKKVIFDISQILNRYDTYNVMIEGYANSISKITKASKAQIEDEELKTLIPLSQGRANFVMDLLVKNSVKKSRIRAIGYGSVNPVVDFDDPINRWKNRRVELILTK